jgi:DNA-binding FrmR family transcriptional regulator
MSSYEDKKDNLTNRLKRIEGQVRGLQKMINEDKYCVDVLIQVNAVKGALNKVGMEVLESHTKGCVTNAIKEEEKEDEIINELMDVVFKFTKK